MLNCCSQDNTMNSRADCTLVKSSNNEIDNNPIIQLENKDKDKINKSNDDINNNINEDDKGGSCKLPKLNKKEEKEAPISGFRRTKTKHFK